MCKKFPSLKKSFWQRLLIEDGPEEKERERSEENPEKERSEKEDGQDGGSSATGSVVCILAKLFMRLFGGSTDPSVITALMH